jgi:hypothetical protein
MPAFGLDYLAPTITSITLPPGGLECRGDSLFTIQGSSFGDGSVQALSQLSVQFQLSSGWTKATPVQVTPPHTTIIAKAPPGQVGICVCFSIRAKSHEKLSLHFTFFQQRFILRVTLFVFACDKLTSLHCTLTFFRVQLFRSRSFSPVKTVTFIYPSHMQSPQSHKLLALVLSHMPIGRRREAR